MFDGTDDALKCNVELFARAFRSSPVGLVISRFSDGLVFYANDAFLHLTEFTRMEVIGHLTRELGIFVSPTQREQIGALLSKGKIQNLEIPIKTKSGKVITILSSIDKITSNGETYVLSTIVDIDERKKTEAALKISEENYRLLFSNMTNGFAYCQMIFSKNGRPVDFVYLEVNDAFEKLTGLKKNAVLAKKVTQAIPTIKHHHPELFEIYGRVATTGKSEHFEIFFKPLSIWLSILAYSPKKGYFAAVFENITEKKQFDKSQKEYSESLELTVAQRTQELIETQNRLLKAERLSAIGELAGMVGHDLRNPLSGIKNAAYMIRKKQNSFDDKGTEMLNIIDRAVEHANSIVYDLLDFSRDLHLELEECSPKSFVNYTLLAMKIPNNIKIVQNIQDSPCIWIDANQMQRVFTNLIKNAIEAMPNGGTLEIVNQQNRGNIDFSFKDTGTGMSEVVLAKIFSPLFTTKPQGMGFGLAICKRIIEAHNGKIAVESIPNKGTKFTLSIPIQSGKSLEWPALN